MKLGFGIPMVLIGLFMTIGGVALMVLVGPDGTFSLPDTHAASNGYALTFDSISVRGTLPTHGSLATTIRLDIRSNDGKAVFVGIGPAAQVRRYLAGVAVDRVIQVNWPGGVRTEAVTGSRAPDPPGDQVFWAASDSGSGSRSVSWTLTSGDWTIVIMNADGSPGLDVNGSGSVTLKLLGPVSVGLLVLGLALLVGGTLLTISGAKTPKTGRLAPAGAPVVAQPAAAPGQPPGGPFPDQAPQPGPPPRPDA